MKTSTIRQRTTGLLATLVALVMMGVAGTVYAGAATAAEDISAPSTVAKNVNGKLKSVVSGKTTGGGKLTGSFTPLKFKDVDGVPSVKGVLDGVITSKDGTKSKFTAIRTLDVKKIAGQKLAGGAVSAEAAAQCDILNLVLGPLDLNILGLEIHLQRVVLDIIAVPGALLGDLLCAISGLLSGGPLPGLLGQLIAILNQILGQLGLGA